MAAFQQLKRACLVSLVVMDLNDPSVDVAGSLLEIRSRWPSVPVVGYAPPATGPKLMSSLPDMVYAGITVVTDWQRGMLDRTIARVLGADAEMPRMSAHFDRELRSIDSSWVDAFCRVCLDVPLDATTVDEVAHQIGGTRQHIASEFQRLRMRQPGQFVTVARLGHAVDRMASAREEGEGGWGEVAATLRWSSPEALRRALQRHAGLSAAAGMTAYGRGRVHTLIRQFLCEAR